MIRNQTARNLLYDWHSGLWSPFYAAASSGLVENFDALKHECQTISQPDKAQLLEWLEHQAEKAPIYHHTPSGKNYMCLPWAKAG